MTTQPIPESAEPAPVATDTQAREHIHDGLLMGDRLTCGPCNAATPAPAGDAEVTHEQARAPDDGVPVTHDNAREFVRRLELHGSIFSRDRLVQYISQQEARQQQGERRVVDLEREHDSLQTQFKLVYRDRDELSRKLEAAEREVTRWRDLRNCDVPECMGAVTALLCSVHSPTTPDQAPPPKPLTEADVRAIARAVVAEVAGGCANNNCLRTLAEAAKEEAEG